MHNHVVVVVVVVVVIVVMSFIHCSSINMYKHVVVVHTCLSVS